MSHMDMRLEMYFLENIFAHFSFTAIVIVLDKFDKKRVWSSSWFKSRDSFIKHLLAPAGSDQLTSHMYIIIRW